jgi:osmotically-inducible protein OsmY
MIQDIQIRQDVELELLYDAGVNAATIGVAVNDGVVTLTGTVSSYAEKMAAVHAAERVQFVRAVACELNVDLPGPEEWTDADLARAVANVLAWNSSVPLGRIRVEVENGWITLEGTVDWQYQKSAAVAAVTFLRGVRGINDLVNVNPLVSAENTKEQIEAGLRRCATIDVRNLLVEVHDDKVVLTGSVHSIPERDEVERIAWSAPGVSDVANHVAITEESVIKDS